MSSTGGVLDEFVKSPVFAQLGSLVPLAMFVGTRVSQSLRTRLVEPDVLVQVFSTSGAQAVAEKIPQSIQELRLDFSGRNVGDDAALLVAEKRPGRLRRLNWDFLFCDVSEAGLGAVAEKFNALEHLSMVFRACDIGDAGARAVAEGLPETLTYLILEFVQYAASAMASGTRVASRTAKRADPMCSRQVGARFPGDTAVRSGGWSETGVLGLAREVEVERGSDLYCSRAVGCSGNVASDDGVSH